MTFSMVAFWGLLVWAIVAIFRPGGRCGRGERRDAEQILAEGFAAGEIDPVELGRMVEPREGDAHALDFPDASFDTVLCTYSLCAIPNEARAVAEMKRVLRPGGRQLLLDHVAAAPRAVRAVQWLIERVSIPLSGWP